ERFAPLHSRRRLVAGALRDFGLRLCRRLTGKDLARIATYDRRDRLVNDGMRYARWIRKYEPTAAQLRRQRHTTFAHRPTVSLILPATGATEKALDESLRSVLAQT